jgi:hypothetical protein
MCLKKKRFLQLLEEFPDAKRFYEKRAIDRRIEFRRVKISILLNFSENEKA